MLVELLFNGFGFSLIAGVAGLLLVFTKQRPIFPVVNDYPGDFLRRKAYREYNKNARKLIADGLAKHHGPITLLVPGGMKIVLPSALSDWVKTNKDLDHQELVREEYFARFPGFEAQYAVHSPDRMLIDMIRKYLSTNETILPTVNQHLATALQEHWGSSEVWHTIDWDKDLIGIISRAAASVFVGPEKAADPDWQTLVQTYVREFFAAVGELHTWPAPSAARRTLVLAAEQESKAARQRGLEAPQYNDAVSWTHNVPGNNLPAGDIQLALAMAALFTTTEALKQVLIDIARHPELVIPLRQEIKQSLSNHGLGLAALGKMELLDSVMKESQRQVPALVGLERKVIRDTFLPDGTRIPQGAHIMVDSSDMWSAEVHDHPESYDGYRFLKRRQAGDKASQFVQSSREHNTFGGGRHICPGRFFASNELKLCLAHILLKYDVRLKDGYCSRPVQFGVYVIVDPVAELEVRRREVPDDNVL